MFLFLVPQVFDQEVREQGATALWALAGHTQKQQKHIAELISYPFVLDLLLSTSDKMQYVGKAAGTGPDRARLQCVLFQDPQHILLSASGGTHKFTIKPSQRSCHLVRSHEVNKSACQAQ